MKKPVLKFKGLYFVPLIVLVCAIPWLAHSQSPPIRSFCGYYTNTCPDQGDPPGCGGDPGSSPAGNTSTCSGCAIDPHGMPRFWVSHPYINLRLEDIPLWWIPGKGQPALFHLSYRQRGQIPEDPTIFGLGANWSCSFRAFVLSLGGTPESLQRLTRSPESWLLSLA